MKKLISIFGIILLVSTVLFGCTSKVSEKDLVGKTFKLDTYHRIKFKTNTRYSIYQMPHNCGGEGNWSLNNGKIILGPNNSNCESTQGMSGSYDYNQLK